MVMEKMVSVNLDLKYIMQVWSFEYLEYRVYSELRQQIVVV